VGFRKAEAQRFDQVKGAVETHANTPDRTGVMGDFRVNEDNMYRRWHGVNELFQASTEDLSIFLWHHGKAEE
jgi:hypothetical protein